MFKKVSQFFYAVPTPVAGLALGIASLGIGLENSLSLHSMGQVFSAILSMILVSMLILKYAFHPVLLKDDMAHPVVGSILPTIAMGLMLQSKSLGFISPMGAEALWLIAILLHFSFLVAFIYFRIKNFKLHHMVPSWFVPFVGISVAAITVPNASYMKFAYVLMVFGMINYAIMLPIMYYRLIFANEIADPFKPTIAILAAPASLGLMSYLSLESNPSLLLCSLLFGIAILMTAIVYIAFFKLLRLPFSPAFAAYTFPMAVGAGSLFKVSDSLAKSPFLMEYAQQIRMLANFELIIACGVVSYVCYCFILYYVRAWKAIMEARRAANMIDECFDKECLHCFSNC